MFTRLSRINEYIRSVYVTDRIRSVFLRPLMRIVQILFRTVFSCLRPYCSRFHPPFGPETDRKRNPFWLTWVAIQKKLNGNRAHGCGRCGSVEVFDLKSDGEEIGSVQCEDDSAVVCDQLESCGKSRCTYRATLVIVVPIGW